MPVCAVNNRVVSQLCSSVKTIGPGIVQNILHAIKAQGIWCITHFMFPNLESSYRWYFFWTLLHHGFLRADSKIEIILTELYHMTFSQMCVEHNFFMFNDTHDYSTFIYWLVFFYFHDQSLHVYLLVLKDVFEIPLLYWCLCSKLKYALLSMNHNLLHRNLLCI